MSDKKSKREVPENIPEESIKIESVEQLIALLEMKRAQLKAMHDLGKQKKDKDDDKPN